MFANMLGYYQMIKEQNINIIYSGTVLVDGVEHIGKILRKRLDVDERSVTASQSVFSVFVEQMHNMQHYSAEQEYIGTQSDGTPQTASKGIFILGTNDEHYYLQTGNLLRNDKIALIQSRIDHLNTMDKAELRRYYKQRIREADDNPDSKGAGLGLIEIARRASSKIEYSFEAYDDKHAFFIMYVEI